MFKIFVVTKKKKTLPYKRHIRYSPLQIASPVMINKLNIHWTVKVLPTYGE
jgi:hypothetical protein